MAAYIITVIRMLTTQIALELKQIENYFQPVKSVSRVVEGAAPPTMQFKITITCKCSAIKKHCI